MLPQEKFLMFQPLRLFLVASEHSDGESLSVISRVYTLGNIHWFPFISSQMLRGCGICLLLRVARIPASKGGGPMIPPAPPPNETLDSLVNGS